MAKGFPTTSRRGGMRRNIHRGGRFLGVSLTISLVTVGLTAFAPSRVDDGNRPDRFEAIPRLSRDASYLPKALRGGGKVTVILELAGKSVGQRIAAAGHQVRSKAEPRRRTLAAEVRREQKPVKAQVRQRGGKVRYSYQYAYNGLSVHVRAKKLDELAALHKVRDVHTVGLVERANTPGVRYIGGDGTWTETGHTGKGITIGIIDTGIDYTHANFGGSGDPSDFESNDGTVIEQGTFPTSKVVGGHDFVGDKYDASSSDPQISTPNPDPDPLDCQGHGSHVAGTAAGMGVLADGSTYDGPYNSGIYDEHDFTVGPGVAPNAKIRAYRVFGCSGSASEDVIVAAMDRALADGVDVVNMSLGSPFGRPDEPSVVAANTLSKAGVTVVASSGNSGSNAYITGAPAVAQRAISVAALDASSSTFPGAKLELSTGKTVTVQNSNGAEFEDGMRLDVKVLRAPDGSVGLGCNPDDYQNVEGKLVVTVRGTCARVHRAIYAQRAGAAAVVMINNVQGYPPFEGEIKTDPITGEKVSVTIPFFGARGVLGPEPSDDGDAIAAAGGGTATLTATTIPNPGYTELADFSSAGPRSVDSQLKPDVTAPGVSVLSTAMGTGTQGKRLSGTSMAAPMTAGAAALVAQAHPGWDPAHIKAALMNTAETGPGKITTYNVRRAGAGVVQIRRAVETDVTATTSQGKGSLSFEYEQLSGAYSETKSVTLRNDGDAAVTYELSARFNGPNHGATAHVSPATVTVQPGEKQTVDVTLSLSEEDVAALPSVSTFSVGAGQVLHIRGAVTATPQQARAQRAGNAARALHVPFLVVPRGLSQVEAGEKQDYRIDRGGTATATVPLTNRGVHAGAADVYAWGIADQKEGFATMDVRSVGVQSLPGPLLRGSKGDRSLTFAINTYGRWSNAAISEFDVLISTDGDKQPEYTVVGVDVGLALSGSLSGVMGSFVIDSAGKDKGSIIAARYAEAPMNGSTLLLPALASEIGLSQGSSGFTYTVNAFSLVPSGQTDTTHPAVFNAHKPALSTGQYVALAPGDKAELELTVRIPRFVRTPALGWLIVSVNDRNGRAQAQRVSVLPDSGSERLKRRLPRPQTGQAGKPGVVPEPQPPVK